MKMLKWVSTIILYYKNTKLFLFVDEDILSMVNILNSVKNEIDITTGLNDNQVYALNQILQKYSDNKNNEDNKQLSSSIIIDKIEDIVNSLFKQKKIRNIEIKQNTEIEYEFNNLVVVLKFEQDNLIVDKEEITLEDWLLEHFSTNEDSFKKKDFNINDVNRRISSTKKFK